MSFDWSAIVSALPELLEGLHYHLVWIWNTSDIWLRLYVRKGSPAFESTVKNIGRSDSTSTVEGDGSKRLAPHHRHRAAATFPGHSGLQN